MEISTKVSTAVEDLTGRQSYKAKRVKAMLIKSINKRRDNRVEEIKAHRSKMNVRKRQLKSTIGIKLVTYMPYREIHLLHLFFYPITLNFGAEIGI